MNNSTCPYCSLAMADGAKCCPRCGWQPKPPASALGGIIACLSLMFFLLLITVNSTYQAFSSSFGDEFGYGRIGLVESGVVLLGTVWLGAALMYRSKGSPSIVSTVIRGSGGFALGAMAIVLAMARITTIPFGAEEGLRTGFLSLAGLGLLVSSVKALMGR